MTSVRPTRSLVLFLLGWLLVVAPCEPAGAAVPSPNHARAVELMQEGRFEEALEQLHELLRALPYDQTVRRHLEECYLGLGLQHLEARRYDEAAAVLAEGQDYGEDRFEFRLYRGFALLRRGDYGGAEAELREAVYLDEKNVMAHRLLGQVYYDSGSLHRAIEAWERARELAPESGPIDELIAKAHRELAVENSMEQDYGGNFIISYDGRAHAELGQMVLEVLEEAYRRIGYDFNYYPDTQVSVLLYTRRDFASLTDSPDWAGGLYDGKIRIPLGGVRAMTPKLRRLLYHEYAHVVIHFLAKGRCPVWLNEGLAQVAERHIEDPPLAALHAAARNGSLLPFARLERSFAGLPREQVRLAYDQSYSLVRYMLEQFQSYNINEILAALAAGQPLARAIAQGLEEYAFDYEMLQRQWRRDLQARL